MDHEVRISKNQEWREGKKKNTVRNSAQQLPYASFQETAEHCRQKWPGVQATVTALYVHLYNRKTSQLVYINLNEQTSKCFQLVHMLKQS